MRGEKEKDRSDVAVSALLTCALTDSMTSFYHSKQRKESQRIDEIDMLLICLNFNVRDPEASRLNGM